MVSRSAPWSPSPPASLRELLLSSRLAPLGPWRLAEHLPVASREVRRRHEAGGAGDAHDRQVGLVDQVARPLEARLEVELGRRAAEVAAEQALELAPREADAAGQRLLAQRLLDVSLHDLDRADQLRVVDAEPHRQRHALAVVGPADAVEDAQLRDPGGHLLAVPERYPVQHQVEGGGPAGAGEALAVALKEIPGHLDVGELLREAGQVLPVDGDAVAVEQAG